MAQTQLSLQPDSHQKFADLSLIIQNFTYRVREMTVTMEFKSAHLLQMTNGEMPTYHIYTFTNPKIDGIENKKGGILNHLGFFPFSVFALYALAAAMIGVNSS